MTVSGYAIRTGLCLPVTVWFSEAAMQRCVTVIDQRLLRPSPAQVVWQVETEYLDGSLIMSGMLLSSVHGSDALWARIM